MHKSAYLYNVSNARHCILIIAEAVAIAPHYISPTLQTRAIFTPYSLFIHHFIASLSYLPIPVSIFISAPNFFLLFFLLFSPPSYFSNIYFIFLYPITFLPPQLSISLPVFHFSTTQLSISLPSILLTNVTFYPRSRVKCNHKKYPISGYFSFSIYVIQHVFFTSPQKNSGN